MNLRQLEKEVNSLKTENSRLKFENEVFKAFSCHTRGGSYIDILSQYGIDSFATLSRYTPRQLSVIPGIGHSFISKMSLVMKDKYNLAFKKSIAEPLCIPHAAMTGVKRKYAILAGINVGDKITTSLASTELVVISVHIFLSKNDKPTLIAYRVKRPSGEESLVNINEVKTLNGEIYNNNVIFGDKRY